MLFKRNAISSLMLELNSDDLTHAIRGRLSNLLAQEVAELTNIPSCAMNLINYEKKIIEQKGTGSDVYLMHSNLNMSEVLKKYYSNIYYENDGSKRLVQELSVSELMLMLGTFVIIIDRRSKIKQSYINCLKRIKVKTGKRFGYYVRRTNGIEEIDTLLYQEETLTDNIKEETAFIKILSENVVLLQQEIYSILGLTEEQKTEGNISKIVKSSKELALSYSQIREDLNKCRKANATLLDDISFLASVGDKPETFECIFESDRPQHEFTKLLKNEG